MKNKFIGSYSWDGTVTVVHHDPLQKMDGSAKGYTQFAQKLRSQTPLLIPPQRHRMVQIVTASHHASNKNGWFSQGLYLVRRSLRLEIANPLA